eukprot:3867664-Prymnesium_polylepis.2
MAAAPAAGEAAAAAAAASVGWAAAGGAAAGVSCESAGTGAAGISGARCLAAWSAARTSARRVGMGMSISSPRARRARSSSCMSGT